MNRVDDALSLAGARIDYAFRGRASHAAASPHLGRSALDAVELMNVGVNYLREHMPTDARVRSEEHTSELQSPCNLVCRLLLEKKKRDTNALLLVRLG